MILRGKENSTITPQALLAEGQEQPDHSDVPYQIPALMLYRKLD